MNTSKRIFAIGTFLLAFVVSIMPFISINGSNATTASAATRYSFPDDSVVVSTEFNAISSNNSFSQRVLLHLPLTLCFTSDDVYVYTGYGVNSSRLISGASFVLPYYYLDGDDYKLWSNSSSPYLLTYDEASLTRSQFVDAVYNNSSSLKDIVLRCVYDGHTGFMNYRFIFDNSFYFDFSFYGNYSLELNGEFLSSEYPDLFHFSVFDKSMVYSSGYNAGYDKGLVTTWKELSPFEALVNGVNDFLNARIFGTVSFRLLFMCGMGVMLVLLLFRLVR